MGVYGILKYNGQTNVHSRKDENGI